MALMDMLLKIREKYSLKIICAHVNHNVRKDSVIEEEYVRSYAINKIFNMINFIIFYMKKSSSDLYKSDYLNDEFLKNNGESPYFEELLARIREIRSRCQII